MQTCFKKNYFKIIHTYICCEVVWSCLAGSKVVWKVLLKVRLFVLKNCNVTTMFIFAATWVKKLADPHFHKVLNTSLIEALHISNLPTVTIYQKGGEVVDSIWHWDLTHQISIFLFSFIYLLLSFIFIVYSIHCLQQSIKR